MKLHAGKVKAKGGKYEGHHYVRLTFPANHPRCHKTFYGLDLLELLERVTRCLRKESTKVLDKK